MLTIHELLSRIAWDPTFGRGEFALAYHDRVRDELLTVPLRSVVLERGDRFAFTVIDPAGVVHRVPFHRIRKVWRDRELIWSRDPKDKRHS